MSLGSLPCGKTRGPAAARSAVAAMDSARQSRIEKGRSRVVMAHRLPKAYFRSRRMRPSRKWKQGGFKIGARTAMSAGSGLQIKLARTSVPFTYWVGICCAAVGFWRGATKEHPRSGAVTEEQRSQKPTAAQPRGRHVFSVQTSLFAPHRPLKGMLVTHASFEPKIHCRKCPPNT